MIMTFMPLIFKDRTGRLLADPYDRSVYFARGKWLTEGMLPISEYPQIPTLLFGIDRLVSNWVGPNLQLVVYISLFSLEMLLVLFLFFKELLELLPPELSNYAFLALLPPTIYFAANRFDILPAYLCLLAYGAATRRKWTLAAFILAIATFTKWYPVLIFPGFFIYATTKETKFQWKMLLAFTLTSVVILFLTYLAGGVESILAPYQFHTARGMEFVAVPVLLDNFLRSLFGAQISLPYFFLFFFIIQLSGPILIFFIKLDSLDALVHYCVLVTGVFVLFSRIWSPQWFLWLMPFLILSAKNAISVWLIVGYNLITYLAFPIIFDAYPSSSLPLILAGLLTYLVLLALMFLSVKNLKPAFYFAHIHPQV